MPPLIELQQWTSLIKDASLAIASIVTIILGVYGMRTWKRELAGKEIYIAVKNLVKESHSLVRKINSVRRPIQEYEHRAFSRNEFMSLTENEMWRIAESEVLRRRLDEFEIAINKFETAKLEARVLLGSRVHGAYLTFGRLITEVVNGLCNYISTLDDLNHPACPDDAEIKLLQSELYTLENFDDDLSQKIADARKEGEKALLPFLHRNRIES